MHNDADQWVRSADTNAPIGRRLAGGILRNPNRCLISDCDSSSAISFVTQRRLICVNANRRGAALAFQKIGGIHEIAHRRKTRGDTLVEGHGNGERLCDWFYRLSVVFAKVGYTVVSLISTARPTLCRSAGISSRAGHCGVGRHITNQIVSREFSDTAWSGVEPCPSK